MPRLGSVLGAILAELERARLVADTLSRDLVTEYRADPILASMSVPRVLLDRAELTLRFAVSDLEEVEAEAPTGSGAATSWARHVAASVLPDVLATRRLNPADRKRTVAQLVGSRDAPSIVVPPSAMESALRGDFDESTRVTTEAVLASWDKLPTEVRGQLGNKAEFRRELEGRFAREVADFVGRARDIELIKAALASRIDVGIRPDELPTQPERTQELRLTLRGEDVSVIVEEAVEQ